MIISFQMWKIVLGLAISGFLLMFSVNYIGGYTAQQNDVLRTKIMNTFELACYNVYNTGNSMVFDDFSKLPFDVSLSVGAEHAIKVAGLGQRVLKVPVLFSIGDKMVFSRAEYDTGWWKFRYVVAMPETEIVLAPGNSPYASETVKGIVKALPDTTNFKNKVTYAVCNGNDIESACGKKPCEAQALLEELESGKALRGGKCTADLKKNQRLVTISMSCTEGTRGVCVEPYGPASGKARLYGTGTVFSYDDYADVAALIVGYEKKDAYGVAGESMYIHKNSEMAKELSLAAKIMARRYELLAGGLSGIAQRGQMDSDAEELGCVKLFQEMAASLDGLASEPLGSSEKAGETKKRMKEMGCDYD